MSDLFASLHCGACLGLTVDRDSTNHLIGISVSTLSMFQVDELLSAQVVTRFRVPRIRSSLFDARSCVARSRWAGRAESAGCHIPNPFVGACSTSYTSVAHNETKPNIRGQSW